MLKSLVTFVALLAAIVAGTTMFTQSSRKAIAHCQVPCGIFDDEARIKALYEDATTIEKAMKLMNELAGETDAQSSQQFVRWTTVKEEHASRVITVISEYFLTQKIKPVAKDADGYDAYLNKLALHHNVLIAAMKSKQTTDVAAATTLREAIHSIEHVWHQSHKH